MKPVTQPEMLLFVPPKVHALRLPFSSSLLFLSTWFFSYPFPLFPLLAASLPRFHARLLFGGNTCVVAGQRAGLNPVRQHAREPSTLL